MDEARRSATPVQQAAEAARSLQEQAARLERLVSAFRLEDAAARPRYAEAPRRGPPWNCATRKSMNARIRTLWLRRLG